jgi:sulfite exporter TauE/SafE
MIAALLLAGFSIGIIGSFHCVGMCGPIALSLPVYDISSWKKIAFIILYNTGRAAAYTLMGILFGVVGMQFFIGGYQQILSVSLGILILIFLIFSGFNVSSFSFINRFTGFIKKWLGQLLRNEKKFYTYIMIGFLNGFLPCGLVYVAIAGAVATGSILNSALFMAAFGLGTFPVMFAVTVLGKYISLQWRNQMRRAVPFFIGVMAVLLILRGLNLGIPFISPEMNSSPAGTVSCCHKE